MTDSKAEAEIQWVKTTLFPKLLKSQNFKEDNALEGNTDANVKLHSVEVKFIGGEEAFMLTTCYRAILTSEQGNSGHKTTTLIVKRTPELPQETFDAIQFGALFSNEILAYETIIPTLEKFAQQTIKVPRFYYGDLGKNYATLVLEDFGAADWRMSTKKANLSLGHALVAVGNLANFHGIGFALRHKNRAEFERLTKDLKEPRYDVEDLHPEWGYVLRFTAERIVIATQKYQPHIDVEFLKRYEKLIRDYVSFGRVMVKQVEPYVTLCHSDYLRNNIAFKYPNDEEEPIDSLMFDLQTMRVCSPMLDFATYLSLSCYADVRCKHFNEIFDKYHKQLVETFKKHTQEIEAPEFLSRESLLSEFRRYFPYSISLATHFLFQLVESHGLTSEEFLTRPTTPEEIREDALTRGGEEVDRELSHQMMELYDFIQKYDVDIFKGFDYV